MTSHRFLVTLLFVFIISSLGFGAGAPGAGKKHLPLDAIPTAQLKTAANSHYLPNKVIIRMKDGSFGLGKRSAISSTLQTFLNRYSPAKIEQVFSPANTPENMDLSKFQVMTYTTPIDPFTAAGEISRQPDVLYAEPWFIYEVDEETSCKPNDLLRSRQWALTKILADTAYCVAQGSPNVVIGIVDTGVEWNHPDLAANIWNNPGETGTDGLGRDKRFNGVDDDGDGYIDDWHGWDFGGTDFNNPVGDYDPRPANVGAGHGTHVAGIADAVTNNQIGISGVANNCRILPVKTGSDNDNRGQGGTPYIVFGFEGFIYAAQRGAQVINASWGGSGASQFEQEIIDSVTRMGALVVSAAGNGNTEAPNYPACYNHVLSVAATRQGSDLRSAYSNFGEHVGVSAPGDNIVSTWFGGTYDSLDGTSMASPHAAGLAALVKSTFPLLTPDQLREQVRVTCSEPPNQGTTYKYKTGRGSINALRAVTVQLPAIRLTSYAIKDSIVGNNNGVVEPNETFALIGTFTNYLQPSSSSAYLTFSTFDTYVSISNGTFNIGAVSRMGSVTNAATPFIVHVNSNIPPGHIVQFVLQYHDGTYFDFQLVSVLMYPTFATHDVNNVQVTFTNNGRIGFNDYSDNSQGVGFTYQGVNELFEGGLIIGTSAAQVSDNIRDLSQQTQDADFIPLTTIYEMSKPGAIADEEGHARYTDQGAPNPMGLTIDQRTFQFRNAPNENYVIVRYDLINTSGADLHGVYAGLFFDWDMQPNLDSNKTGFDQSRNLGYAWDKTQARPVYCGVRALDAVTSFRGLYSSSADFTRQGKFSWLSGGIVPKDSTGDVNMSIGAGPFNIAAGDSQRVTFALIAGSSLADLQRNADAASAQWEPGGTSVDLALRQGWNLQSNPLQLADNSIAAMYPQATNAAFRFAPDSGYVRTGVATPGTGYWIKLDASAILSLTGAPISAETLHLAPNWNMIGPISYPITEAAITRDPPSMGLSHFFGYSDMGYYLTDTLKPGVGYWVKSDVAGTIILTAGGYAAKAGRSLILASGELPPPPPTEAAGPEPSLPKYCSLGSNYPNPFNPSTDIGYQIAPAGLTGFNRTGEDGGFVTLKVFDLLGREVALLVNGQQAPGGYHVTWNASDMPSGVYLYRLTVVGKDGSLRFSEAKKLMLLR